MHSALTRWQGHPAPFVIAALVFAAAWVGGASGIAYLVVYAAAVLPGLPVGFALFGRSGAGWIAGAPMGYALSAFALWIPIYLGVPSMPTFAAAWGLLLAGTSIALWRHRSPLVSLPAWTPAATRALCVLLLLTLALVTRPYSRIGEEDAAGNRRYRAYFTADFVWHEALTAEVARFSSPPRNPYLASRPLQYYWMYFVVPAVATSASSSHSPPIETYLAVGGLCTGMLLISAVFLAAWAAVPRPRVVGTAVGLVAFAWSAEGTYVLYDLYRRGQPLSGIRELNIDAITSWYFQALTIDGLPRAIWYNPQHSMACVLGLVALTIATRGGAAMGWRAAAVAGTALGLGLMMSPFPGGALILIYAVAVLWDTPLRRSNFVEMVSTQAAAVVPVAAALAWDLFNETFEGAGSAIAIGLSSGGRKSFGTPLLLAIGPVLIPAFAGLLGAVLRLRTGPMQAAIAGVTVSIGLMFFVTLTLEPIWIGWRAGQVFLVTCPALVAAALASLRDVYGKATTATVIIIILAIGMPTTIIDAYNAQDVDNVGMGAGFHWTVIVTREEQQALQWIERFTPPDALVQMSLNPRGRETWTLIPSFARRRMAAGLPISLLRTPLYDQRAEKADSIFGTGDAETASQIAREMRIDYLYVGRVEREAFGASISALDTRPDLFPVAFRNSASTVYAVK